MSEYDANNTGRTDWTLVIANLHNAGEHDAAETLANT
ncbi:hypothetical protein SAMN05428970_2006 [Agromyces sp. CF514]|nr:hypothetical protein SAMN05428970_2006 [Agromyces sp. CF514]